MNIETLKQYAEAFTREVLDSGFKRDLEDYIESLPASQNNILGLREMAEKVLTSLEGIYSGDLPDALEALLPTSKVRPFTESPHDQELRNLIDDSEIAQQAFFTQLDSRLTQLKQQIDENINEIAKIEQFINPYVTRDISHISDEGVAIFAIIFNDRETITSLSHFVKTVAYWNRILPVYHQLLKGESPEDVKIVEVQNGSIDLIVNLDVDVAIDLAKVFKVGFKVFVAYLGYKKMIEPIIESYYGNKKLIEAEENRETLMLENIGEAVKAEILKQHKIAKQNDRGVDGTAITKKIEQVANLVTSHIVKGNDVRVLALPETSKADEGREVESSSIGEELRQESTAARRALREIPPEAQQKLLQTYKDHKNEEFENKPSA